MDDRFDSCLSIFLVTVINIVVIYLVCVVLTGLVVTQSHRSRFNKAIRRKRIVMHCPKREGDVYLLQYIYVRYDVMNVMKANRVDLMVRGVETGMPLFFFCCIFDNVPFISPPESDERERKRKEIDLCYSAPNVMFIVCI